MQRQFRKRNFTLVKAFALVGLLGLAHVLSGAAGHQTQSAFVPSADQPDMSERTLDAVKAGAGHDCVFVYSGPKVGRACSGGRSGTASDL